METFIRILKKILHKTDIDRAVFFGLSAKMWAVISGPVTAFFIASKFSPELQGYYYTFASLLGLQVFIELGLGTVTTQFAAHEWSHLSLDKNNGVQGDPEALSRLISLTDIVLKWYVIGSMVLTLGLALGGYSFFPKTDIADINWITPWFSLCLFTGISICLTPLWSLLEGCNQVNNLYTYRFFQSFFSNLAVWAAIVFGAKLWTASISVIVICICATIFIRIKYWNFFKVLILSRPQGPRFNWMHDIFPMQWRIALSWASGYLVFSLFTPVIFKFHGAVIAGQMGMTWSIVGTLVLIATAWLNPKVPQFGMLIAKKKYDELDKLFWRITKMVTGVAVLLAVVIWLMVYFIYSVNFKFAYRILPPLPTGLFLLAQVIMASSAPFSAYLRAHKKEPLLFLSILAGILTAVTTLIFGKIYSAAGMAAGYLTVNIIIFPLIVFVWYRCKNEWHKDDIMNDSVILISEKHGI